MDDDAIIGLAVRETIEQQENMIFVGCLLDTHSLPEEIASRKPDVLLLDLTIPGCDSLEALKEISRSVPDIITIVFSGAADPALRQQALDLGAAAFVVKNGDWDCLIRVLQEASRSRTNAP